MHTKVSLAQQHEQESDTKTSANSAVPLSAREREQLRADNWRLNETLAMLSDENKRMAAERTRMLKMFQVRHLHKVS